MSKEKNEGRRSDCVSPSGNRSSSRQSEFSGRSDAWLGSGRVRPSSWDDSDEELSPKQKNPQTFRIHSGKSQEEDEMREIKNQFFRGAAKEERSPWADRRQSSARVRRRTKSSSSSSPVFEHRSEAAEELDNKTSNEEVSEFESDPKFVIGDFYAELHSTRFGLEAFEPEWQIEDPKLGSAERSSENSKLSEEEEDEAHFSRTSRKLSQILEVEELRKDELSERADRGKEGERSSASSARREGPLGPATPRPGKADPGRLRLEPEEFEKPLGLGDFRNLMGKHGPFEDAVRDEVIFLTAKCGKTEIGLTKETGWLDDKSFQLPAPRTLNEILRIDLGNESPGKGAENSSRAKSPKFKLNLESSRGGEKRSEEETRKKSTRNGKTENSTLGESKSGSRRSFQSGDEKSTWRKGREEVRSSRLQDDKMESSRIFFKGGENDDKSGRSTSPDAGSRRSGQSERVQRKQDIYPDEVREVKSAEIARGKGSKSEGRRHYEKITPPASTSSSDDSFEPAESERSLKEIGKASEGCPGRSDARKSKRGGSKEESPKSSNRKTCEGEPARESSGKTVDSIEPSSGRSTQRGRPEPEGGRRRKKKEPEFIEESCSYKTNDSREEGRKVSNEPSEGKSKARTSVGGMWNDLIETFHGNQEFPLDPRGSFPGFPSQKEDAKESPPASRRPTESSARSREDRDLRSGRRSGEKKDEKLEETNLDPEEFLTEKMSAGSEAHTHRTPQSLFYFDVGKSGMFGIGEFGDVVPWVAGDHKSIQPETPKAHGDGNPPDQAWEGLPLKRQRPKKGKELRIHRQLWTESKDDLNGASSETLSASVKLSRSSTCVSGKEDAGEMAVPKPSTDCLTRRKAKGRESSAKSKTDESSASSEDEESEGSGVDSRGPKWRSFMNSKAFFEKPTKVSEKDLNVFSAQKREEGKSRGNNWLVVGRRRRGKRKREVSSRESSRGSDREFLFGRGLRSSVTPLKFRNSSCLRNFYKRLVGVFCLTSDSSVGSSK